MTFIPTPKYRYSTAAGMQGIEVLALQINLNELQARLVADGIFGPATDKALRSWQELHGLVADGVAGVLTQRTIILKLAEDATKKMNLPLGLLKSIASNESGFILAAYSRHPSDGGFDFGPYQLAFPPEPMFQQSYNNACDALIMANKTGLSSRTLKNEFRKAPFVKTDKYAWQLATLNHNWPFAAHNLAFIGSIYQNPAEDTQPQAWISAASGGRLSTPRQWCDHYIAAATVFVTTWPA